MLQIGHLFKFHGIRRIIYPCYGQDDPTIKPFSYTYLCTQPCSTYDRRGTSGRVERVECQYPALHWKALDYQIADFVLVSELGRYSETTRTTVSF